MGGAGQGGVKKRREKWWAGHGGVKQFCPLTPLPCIPAPPAAFLLSAGPHNLCPLHHLSNPLLHNPCSGARRFHPCSSPGIKYGPSPAHHSPVVAVVEAALSRPWIWDQSCHSGMDATGPCSMPLAEAPEFSSTVARVTGGGRCRSGGRGSGGGYEGKGGQGPKM